MKKFKVEFEFMYLGDDSDGQYHIDYLDNNGKGFSYKEAEDVAKELRESTIQRTYWTEIVEMKGEN